MVDSSTPLRSGRNDIRFCVGRYRFKYITIPAYAGWRWVIAATLRGSIHPDRLYLQRSGRQVCRPYMKVPRFSRFFHNLFMGCGIFLWMESGSSKVLKIDGLFCPFIRCALLHDVGFHRVRSRIFSTFCERAVEKTRRAGEGCGKRNRALFRKVPGKGPCFFKNGFVFQFFHRFQPFSTIVIHSCGYSCG